MSNQTAHWTAQLISRELDGFANELALYADDSLIWSRAPGINNSVGTLVLHVCGNLQHFIGGVLGHTGYVRDRDSEFSRTGIPKDALLKELTATAAIVVETLEQVSPDQLDRPFPQPVGGITMPTGLLLTHLAVHTAFHLGQAGYLRRVLSGDRRSAGPLPLTPLVGGTLSR